MREHMFRHLIISCWVVFAGVIALAIFSPKLVQRIPYIPLFPIRPVFIVLALVSFGYIIWVLYRLGMNRSRGK